MPRLSVEDIQRAALLQKLKDEARVLQNVNIVKEHHRRLVELKESHRAKAEDRKVKEREAKKQEKERIEADKLRTAKATQDRTSSIREARKSGIQNAQRNFQEGNNQKRLDEQRLKHHNATIRAAHEEKFRDKARSIKADVDRTTRRMEQRQMPLRDVVTPEKTSEADRALLEDFSQLSMTPIERRTADAAQADRRRDARLQAMSEVRKKIQSSHQASITKALSCKKQNKLDRSKFERRQEEERSKKVAERKLHHDRITLELNRTKQDTMAKNKATVAQIKNRQAISPRNVSTQKDMHSCPQTPTKQVNRRHDEPLTPQSARTPTTLATPTDSKVNAIVARLREQEIQEAQQFLRQLKAQNSLLTSKPHDTQRKPVETKIQSPRASYTESNTLLVTPEKSDH
ncbi:hypothetical protein XU18_1405 [Perkinsela sp. CCAP 1560/4]|nr:hypothetical protein XU18_1405 [Perkinsela sp. CCAP 1560/4]|eukprot:KNH08075.1 hypothetical protein XU18_1405 [Perkinsela sp. CCAP 1560/4]